MILDDLIFDLSKVTINEAINVPNLNLNEIVEYFDKITPGIDMFELPFNLLPVVLAHYKAYVESFCDPDNIIDQFRNLLDDLNGDG